MTAATPETGTNDSVRAIMNILSFYNGKYDMFAGKIYTKLAVYLSPSLKQEGLLVPLLEASIPFDIIRQLDKHTLKGFHTLLLLNAFNLSDQQIEALSDFANNGGMLIATRNTGINNEHGFPRTRQLWNTIALSSNNVALMPDIYLKDTLFENMRILREYYKPVSDIMQSRNLVCLTTDDNNLEVIPLINAGNIAIHLFSHDPDKTYRNINIAVTLPPNLVTKQVSLYSLNDTNHIPLNYTNSNEGGAVGITIPRLTIFATVVIQSVPSDNTTTN